MYDYKIIIKMSNGCEYSYNMRNNKHILSETEKNQIVDNIFNHTFINLYEFGDYVVLNTKQISSVIFHEMFDCYFQNKKGCK